MRGSLALEFRLHQLVKVKCELHVLETEIALIREQQLIVASKVEYEMMERRA